MDLAKWNDRLTCQFSEVRQARQARGTDLPIFALEHGLTQTEIQELSAAVRAHVQRAVPAPEHALAWIVYASEIGYRYSGDEYWQTFEGETPGWTARGDRSWIRDCFRAFHTKFGGAIPSGRWAEHFSIICWPITHAILPRDLQQQLARILYEVRHSFSAELFESPTLLGEFIAARSWNASSRFQNLAEETALVGQVAAALLLQGNLGTEALIHPATLLRIGNDVDRERRGRDWLRGARRFAEERAKIRGLALGGAKASPVRRPEEARAEVSALGIEPRLVLRPNDASHSRWEVSLEIPDLSHLILRFPRARNILAGCRCVVAGAAGRPLARGRCLHGAQRVVLSRWPRSDEVLLQFEQTDPQLEYLLRAECLLRPGPTWLFRIASDGLAYEARGLRVRAGGRYVLVSTARPVRSRDHLRPIEIACEGVYGSLLELPKALTPDWEETLRQLGITQAKSIEVWPAGLAAVVWDGEGHGEWLASERPCLAVCSDHAVGTLLVSLGSRPELSLELAAVAPGEPVFIELPLLPVGLHKVSVAARSGRGADAEPLGDLDVVMRVREARPWSPGVNAQGPISVDLEPAAPTLEQLWEGRVDVTVRGPVGRAVKCRVSMFDRASNPATFARQLPPLELPMTCEQWLRQFDKHIRETLDAQRAYDEARLCEVEFSADELGAFSVRCERAFTPLRWTIRRRAKQYIARLHEDVGSGAAPSINRLSFEQPTVSERLDAMSEYVVPPAGGLYVAQLSEFTSAMILPPAVRGLSDLRCVPRVDDRERSVETVLRLIGFARLWGIARLPGDVVSRTRQRAVLQALTSQIFQVLGGDAWGDAEAAARTRYDWVVELKRSVSRKREEAAIGAALALECEALASAAPNTRVTRVATLVGRFVPLSTRSAGKAGVGDGGPDDPSWLAELALRLASDPVGAEVWAGGHLRAGVARLFEVPTLARAARFLVIATDHHLNSHAAAGELYAGWGWQ